MAKLDDIGNLMWIYVEDISYTHVKVSPEQVAQIKAQGRNWQPALIMLTGYDEEGNDQYQCSYGHEIISAVKEAGIKRVWTIQVPDLKCK